MECLIRERPALSDNSTDMQCLHIGEKMSGMDYQGYTGSTKHLNEI
jgi:hypothetical protein